MGFGSATTALLALVSHITPAFSDSIPVPHRNPQIPLVSDTSEVSARNGGRLHGRFLHITDFHPDKFYKTSSSTSEDGACHRGSGSAGYYGAETSDCDSPITLVNATFDWLAAHVKGSIDFVLWTGDSARHDNDESIPRSRDQIRELNSLMVRKFEEVFGRERDNDDPYDDFTVPIVPNIGNNDILPHNIFDFGPNEWTRTYLDLWRSFIPEEERHEFDESGWFAVDVIPNYLTVFSLNTMYFFTKNAAVDGCSLRSEPGYRQMEWLRVQLQFLRQRGMKAILIGHVPPARTEGKHNWDETCWQKYALWMRQYRDVVVGSVWGHMNIDHFIVQDFDDIDPSMDKGVGIEESSFDSKQAKMNSKKGDGKVNIKGASSYVTEMRALWASLPHRPKGVKSLFQSLGFSDPASDDAFTHLEAVTDSARPAWEVDALVKKGKKSNKGKSKKPNKGKERDYLESIGGAFAERFAVAHVGPSVIPNYYPTFRIVEYNITGVDYRPPAMAVQRPKVDYAALGLPAGRDDTAWLAAEDEAAEEGKQQTVGGGAVKQNKKNKKKKKANKKRRFTIPLPPSRSAPPGPAYSPQRLSWIGYEQWFANLTTINNAFVPAAAAAAGQSVSTGGPEDVEGEARKDGKHGQHNGKKPRQDGKPDPNKFQFEVLYDTRNDSKGYGLASMIVREYVELASRMGRGFKAVVGAESGGDVQREEETRQPRVKGERGEETQPNLGDDKGETAETEEAETEGKAKSKKGRALKTKKKGKKGKKGKKCKKGKGGMNGVWKTFISRAFVGTLSDDEIKDQFGGA